MKIRIHNNFIRLRLDQTEVQNIESGQPVNATTAIPGNTLHYSVEVNDDADIQVNFMDAHIKMSIPKSWVTGWLESDLEGFENNDQSQIRIAIEKDYKCLHREPEGEGNNFENPAAS